LRVSVRKELAREGFLAEEGDDDSVHAMLEGESGRDELARRVKSLTQLEAVARVAAGVAHDLNNVLAVVETYTGFVKEGALGQQQRHDLEIARNAARRGAQLTAQLLSLSVPTSFESKLVDLNELVRGLDGMLRRVLRTSVSFAVQPAAAPLTVRADPVQIDQAILHLVLNARDATPDGGSISVSLKNSVVGPGHPMHGKIANGSYGVIAVRDTGGGMDPATQTRIFEPFFTTKPGDAAGLGLVIVTETARQLRGGVQVESTRDQGSEFSLYLPIAAVSQAPKEGPSERSKDSETLLIVDDDPALRAAIRRILEAKGFRVLEAADGNEAGELASHHEGPIDLVLCDLVMPGLGGREAAERVRAAKPQARVVFTSGYPLEHGSTNDGEPVEFVAKPFTPDELVSAVKKCLEAPRQGKPLPAQPVVLLVDDEPNLRSSLARVLEECEVSTLGAKSSLHALQILQEQHVDVIVSDQFMPGMDGVRLLESVRQRWPHCTRILFTAHPSSDIVVEAINRGGVHKVLVKSMHPVAIRDEIAKAARVAQRARR
jgi:two-component system cell cycle sensor histidine kinase/response regulator CckA